jgi:hypothetical protein
LLNAFTVKNNDSGITAYVLVNVFSTTVVDVAVYFTVIA